MLRGGVPSPALRRRVEAAYRFGRGLEAPLYLVSGALGRHGPAEAVVMRDLLTGFGVPAEDILLDQQSRDTLQSAINSCRILRGRSDIGEVYVCSSDYHLPRCRLLVRMLGFAAEAAPVPSDRRSMGPLTWAYFVFRETVAVPYDAALLFFRRMWLRG